MVVRVVVMVVVVRCIVVRLATEEQKDISCRSLPATVAPAGRMKRAARERLRFRIMVGASGFEPLTSTVSRWRSYQLS